jgi:hypothetical protein
MKNKNFYVVALISFFDNDIKQFEIKAESPYEAVKKGMLEMASEKHKQDEIDFQNSEDYPKTIEEMEEHFANCDMDFSVFEVGSFL